MGRSLQWAFGFRDVSFRGGPAKGGVRARGGTGKIGRGGRRTSKGGSAIGKNLEKKGGGGGDLTGPIVNSNGRRKKTSQGQVPAILPDVFFDHRRWPAGAGLEAAKIQSTVARRTNPGN